ncbi:uncharacterized protein LOC106668223 [Cimex lectularius]|uniref:Uncharacterized protein n=1 Tax=Cimex lectularius TaxID=79782 RepID=A0A8I6RYM3_CIMLE|nr:uncharacterized protein LOC106668223 [Cimex lectularius]
MYRTLLVTVSLLTAQEAIAICIGYAGACEEMMAMSCCFYPFVGCLQDTRNSTSCISILDAVNLSPEFTSLNPFTPALQNFENASYMFLMEFAPLVNPFLNPITDPLVLFG